MAEAAGTALGIISFGLQLYTGLSEYLDAVKGREEDLLGAKNNAKTLQCSLKAIEDTMSQVNGNAMAQDAVEECKSSCESELKALYKLLNDLQGKPIDPADPITKVKSSMQKWSYPFKKKNIARLEERLKSANNVLKTALSALQLAILNDQSTAILSLQQTMATILAQTESISRTAQFPYTKADEILDHLRNAETIQTQVAQLVSYPKDLQILCDAVSKVSLRSEPQSTPPNPHTIRSITRQRGRTQELCNCAKRQHIQRSTARLGLVFFETESKRITHHAPECPLSQVVTSTEQKRNAVGISIPNILNILKSAVGVSISLTTGAGGFSLAQNITWSPTVDESLSPAFKLIRALCDLKTWREPSLGKKEYEMIATSCVRRLHLCYAKRQASPVDMNSNGESVLDVLASGMQSDLSLGNEAADDVAFVFRSLATIEVPITYDRDGNLRFLPHVLESTWLLNTNTLPETMSALLSRCGESTRHDYASVFGFDNYPKRRSILKEFPQVAQSLGFNPLSIAVLREDEDDVRFLIKKYPSFRMEVNYCGQSPVHVAVLVGNLDILSLVIKDLNLEAINTRDSMQRYPIDYAVSHLLGKPKANDQKSCVSCTMVELLLDSKAVLYESSLEKGLWNACTRTKTAILQHLAQRRKELEQLAVSNLPATEVQDLGLCRGWILDRNTFKVQCCLKAQSCSVPSYLKARCDKQPAVSQETPKSVYTYILDRETAEYAFSLGFDRETAFIDTFRRITRDVIKRGSRGWPSPWYIDWILDGGGDLASTVPLDFVPGVVNLATWAHYLMSALGYKARYYPYRLYDNVLPQSVTKVTFSEVLGDDCQCHCSVQGCTPLIKFLEGLGCRRRFPRTWFTLTEAIRSFVASIQALIAGEHTEQSWMPRAVLRYATFSALGLRHTCCKHAHGGLCSSMDSDEIDEIHEEDSATLQQLEDLVAHFGNGYGSMTTLDVFLKDVWLLKMKEVYEEMASYQITEEELKKAEDCGVKLAVTDSKPILGCEPPEPSKGSYFSIKVDVDEPEGFPDIVPIGLGGWMERLDEIAIDPDRSVLVTPASSSTIAVAQTGASYVA
ncbi:uncharacterized protein FSUBG_7416 [Fusarium subglutinans]|uniref:Fungal N-terminal domain-containing protein n=1 Tax=Gibberella subglutinans TaxID=42677 RepID=A0A8H5PUE7_GIBSU|nr:uncharacterized protein FSUBG_7416 [Fusarium subglutinans]KAF5603192.1 hypothetical protein FSUBG_7416 [Fusarium subglutinans]